MGLFNKLSEQPPSETTVQYEMKRNKRFAWRDVVVCLLIVGVFLLVRGKLGLGNTGGLSIDLEETRCGITDLEGTTHYFTYDDAESIELCDGLKSFDRGELLSGTENSRVCSGTFRNAEFGDYQLHVQLKLSKYIVVHDAGGVLVFNLESDQTTEQLLDYFLALRSPQASG